MSIDCHTGCFFESSKPDCSGFVISTSIVIVSFSASLGLAMKEIRDTTMSRVTSLFEHSQKPATPPAPMFYRRSGAHETMLSPIKALSKNKKKRV